MDRKKYLSLNDESISYIIIASTIFVGIVLFTLIKVFDLHAHIKSILIWIDSAGIYGPIIFIFIVMLVVILLFPGVLITMGAGFIFGVVKGSIYIVIGTTIGATISFCLAKYIFSDKVSQYLLDHKKAMFLNQYLAKDGWKIIFFTRLIPFFPFKLSNYLFGLTKFSLRSFMLGTFLGIWPITIFNVYVGSLASTLSRLGEYSGENKVQLYFYIFGFFASIFAIIYITKKARLAMNRYLQAENNNY